MLIYKAGGPAHRAAGSRLHTTCETSQFWIVDALVTHKDSWPQPDVCCRKPGFCPPTIHRSILYIRLNKTPTFKSLTVLEQMRAVIVLEC